MNGHKKNGISTFLKFIGGTIMVLSYIAGFILLVKGMLSFVRYGNTYAYYALICFIGGTFSGALWLGLGELLQLMTDIRDKL